MVLEQHQPMIPLKIRLFSLKVCFVSIKEIGDSQVQTSTLQSIVYQPHTVPITRQKIFFFVMDDSKPDLKRTSEGIAVRLYDVGNAG